MSKTMLTKREKSTLERAIYMQCAGKIVQRFVESGWKSLDAVASIFIDKYPRYTKEQVYNFWSYKTMNKDILHKMEIVLDNLKSE